MEISTAIFKFSQNRHTKKMVIDVKQKRNDNL